VKDKEPYGIAHTIDSAPGAATCGKPGDSSHNRCAMCGACCTCMGHISEVMKALSGIRTDESRTAVSDDQSVISSGQTKAASGIQAKEVRKRIQP
jgi:hypothetical protein